ncbi:MAG: putative membrane protein [Bermanella sp.]|jgi:uncharacterized membrane protein
MTLFSPDNDFGLLAIILALVALGIAMESRPRIGQFGVIFIILFPALLSAFNVLPRGASVYGMVVNDFVPLSLPMLLFQADLRRIWRESGRVIIAFLGAAAATVMGAMLALPLVDLGPEEGVWVGILTAGFIGGSANAGSVAVALDKAADPMMGVAVASVFAVAVPFLALLLTLPNMPRLWKFFSPHDSAAASLPPAELEVERQSITTLSLVASLALSALICLASESLANVLNYPPAKFLLITIFSVAFATLLPSRAESLHGHYELGQILIYCFFAVIGVQINFVLAITEGLQIMLFTGIVLSVHLVLLSLFGRILKLSGAELAVASNACILSAPTAAAMAVARGWHNLVTPALLCGVFGYAIANLVGISLAELL